MTASPLPYDVVLPVPTLHGEEPPFGPWRRTTAALLVERLGAPRVVAIDGSGGSGKSTLVARLAAAVPGSAVVHTDDLAWHHSFFGWSDLLIDGVLRPYREGRPVAFRPPAWHARDRPGAIEVPAGATLLFVEGTGAGRRELSTHVDAVLWVQADADQARRLALDRDVAEGANGDRAQATAFWDDWMAEELPFRAADRPWERADVVVAGVGLADPGELLVTGQT